MLLISYRVLPDKKWPRLKSSTGTDTPSRIESSYNLVLRGISRALGAVVEKNYNERCLQETHGGNPKYLARSKYFEGVPMKSVRTIIFGLSMIVSLFASVSQAQMMSSSYSCAAYTDCTDAYGRFTHRISCQVYGGQYASGLGISSNATCQWGVIPNQSVQCAGYQQTQDMYGRTMWAWANFAYSCR